MMESKRIHGKTAFMAALFVSSISILGIKLFNPSPIQIFVEGSSTAISQIPGFYTFSDVIILIISSFVLCASGMYLLFFDKIENNSIEKPAGKMVLEERKKEWGGGIKDTER